MLFYGTKSAAVFLAAVIGLFGWDDLSSTQVYDGTKTFCPDDSGQTRAQKKFDSVFTESNFRAEDTGVEPATHCWAIDFESTC